MLRVDCGAAAAACTRTQNGCEEPGRRIIALLSPAATAIATAAVADSLGTWSTTEQLLEQHNKQPQQTATKSKPIEAAAPWLDCDHPSTGPACPGRSEATRVCVCVCKDRGASLIAIYLASRLRHYYYMYTQLDYYFIILPFSLPSLCVIYLL